MALDGKRILVTGGTSGLGRTVAQLLLARGAWVAVTYRKNEELAGLLSSIPSDGPQPEALYAELTDRDSVARIAEEIAADLPLDALACIAGDWSGGKPLWEAPSDEMAEQFGTNVSTLWNTLHTFLPGMVAAGRGRVVTVGARHAERPMRDQAAYTASKAAVIGLTRALAEDLRGTGVSAACVLPSSIGTPEEGKHTGIVRVPAHEVAEVVAWLLDDDAAVLNGATVPVYGHR